MLQDSKILEDIFYSGEFYMSYSSLSRLLFSPKSFYNYYILNKKEESNDSLYIEGRVLHCLMLNPEEFDNKFVLAKELKLSANDKIIINRLYSLLIEKDLSLDLKLIDLKDEILSILKELKLHQSLKTDEKRIDTIINDSNEDYFNFLKTRTGKTIVDNAIYEKCVGMSEALKNNEEVCNLLGINELGKCDIFNEIELKIKLDDFNFGLKGIIDNIKVDSEAKTVYINDIKTTSKTIADFKDSVNLYNYWLQAAIYYRIVRNIIHPVDTKDQWDYIFTFIVIDKYSQIYCFEVSEDTMTDWLIDLQVKLGEASYHYNSKDYSLPYKFVIKRYLL